MKALSFPVLRLACRLMKGKRLEVLDFLLRPFNKFREFLKFQELEEGERELEMARAKKGEDLPK